MGKKQEVVYKMVNFCAMNGCSNRTNREINKSYYCLPSVKSDDDEEAKKLTADRRVKWLSWINRSDWTEKKLKYARVCSDHFVTGEHKFVCSCF